MQVLALRVYAVINDALIKKTISLQSVENSTVAGKIRRYNFVYLALRARFYLCSVKHEKKQLGLYKVCEYEQRSIQSALENLLDDLASLKSANANVEQAAHKRRYHIKDHENFSGTSNLTTLLHVARRMKAESQLLAIIAKYDAEIGGRQEMMQELNETNEHDTVEKHALKVYLYFTLRFLYARAVH